MIILKLKKDTKKKLMITNSEDRVKLERLLRNLFNK